jgi:hypothetical protein
MLAALNSEEEDAGRGRGGSGGRREHRGDRGYEENEEEEVRGGIVKVGIEFSLLRLTLLLSA